MPLAKRDQPPILLVHLAAALGVGLLLGFMGPFGSYPSLERPVRYGFWLGLGLAGYGSAWAMALVLRSAERVARLNLVAQATVVGLASAIPMTFIASWALAYVQPGRTFAPPQLLLLFAAVAAVQLIIAALFLGLERGMRRPASTTMAERPVPAPRFLSRLPADLGSELFALQAEDHYLRVHTRAGSALILYRLSDALADLSGQDGLRVHRGWWVAADAVAGTQRDGTKLSLLLENGLRVPVSRAHVRSVNARQWPRIQERAA